MNLCILCLDALRDDHVRPEVMPYLSGLLASGRRYTDMRTKVAWTLPSVAAMLTGDDDAFAKGSDGMVGSPTLAGMLSRTHATAAFIGQPVVASTPETAWLWEEFDCVWACTQEEAWPTQPRGMAEVWAEFIAWREGRRGPRGLEWFAYVHLYEVHEPYTTGDILASTPHTVDNGYFTHRLNIATGEIDATPEEQQALREAYAAYCRITDERLAKVLPGLLDGDTLLTIMSDHGDNHGEEGVWGHGWTEPYQTDIARGVVMGIVGPGITSKTVSVKGGPCETNALVPYLVKVPLRLAAEGTDVAAVEEHLRDLGYLGGA